MPHPSHLHALLHTFLMGRLIFCADNRIPHFFMTSLPSDEDLLLQHPPQHLDDLANGRSHCHQWRSGHHHGLLRLHHLSSPPEPLSQRQVESLFYLRLPPHCGGYILYGTSPVHRPLTSYSVAGGRILTVMYTVVTPMLNPFIYSLRNKDVKEPSGNG